MALPSWTPKVFSEQEKQTMLSKPVSQITKLAGRGSLLALHVLAITPNRQRAKSLPTYCSFLQHSDPPDSRLLAANDESAWDAIHRACYCLMGASQVLRVLPSDPYTELFKPMVAAWNGVFRWMVYVYGLYCAEDPQHPMFDIFTMTIFHSNVREEMQDLFCKTAGILEFTTSLWINGALSSMRSWNLAGVLNWLSLSSTDDFNVLVAGKAGHVADRLVCCLRQATRTHASSLYASSLFGMFANLQLVAVLGVKVGTPVRLALSNAGIIRAVTKALVRMWALHVERNPSYNGVPHVGFSMVVSFLEAGAGIDFVRQSVRSGLLGAILDAGPHFKALPGQVPALVNAIIENILPRYIIFRSVTEAVCKSLRALRSAGREAHFADSKVQRSWDTLVELARSRERVKHTLESYASRSRATCDTCLVTGRKTDFKRCSGCHGNTYCSVQCQKVAWEVYHKSRCAEDSRHYLATALSHSDASFHKAVVAFDAKRLVPKLRALAAQQYPNILLCSLILSLDYTKSAEPQFSLVDRFNDEGERATHCASPADCASTMIWYKIRLGEQMEFSNLRIASLWSEGEVGGEISGSQVEDFDIREVLDDVAERVSRVAAVTPVNDKDPVRTSSGV
ncbi:hypothetical protein FA95DRAFT_1594932 [Auriscalpium vulgare]|uniref:Uncharacterized protein n=1 Tax=Auriscalpium vulgare TaxID=40419 RepID=A0ACB8RYE7_9AGAM|nr:hypothetical protein FA95DRAFT_1594932 [Auriscalpium vulgare]